MDQSLTGSPVTKVSRFQVSVIPETNNEVKETKRETKTGRFSVVTHEETEREEKEPTMFYKTTPAAFLIGATSSTEFNSCSVSIPLPNEGEGVK